MDYNFEGKAKSNLFFTLFWATLIVVFLVTAWFLILSAMGYRINPKTYKLIKTGVISVETEPREVIISVNGQTKNYKTPLGFNHILPGVYDITISHAGYLPWSRVVYVDPGKVAELNHIVLFLQDQVISPAQEQDKQILDSAKEEDDLYTEGFEIFYLDKGTPKLITRLSQEIKSLRWYPDKNHIAYQVGSEIKIAELDGQGAETILKLDKTDAVKMVFQDNGQILLASQGDKIYRVKIR